MDEQTYRPSEALRRLDRLTGTWQVTGGAEGTVSYEWMDGGFFLVQRLDLVLEGRPVRGVEIIGHIRPFGEKPDEDIRSRFYDAQGNTIDYMYDLDGDTLTIWGGERGSPYYFRGRFSDDGTRVDGEWVYPGGGGYHSSMARVS